MNRTTGVERRNKRMHAMFDRAREHDKEIKKMPLEYAAGTIGNAARGPVAMLKRGAWGYDDDTGKLFAAAPDLLAALELADRFIRGQNNRTADGDYCFKWRNEPLDHCGCELCIIRAAIAKARVQ